MGQLWTNYASIIGQTYHGFVYHHFIEFCNNQGKVTQPLRVRKLHNMCKQFHPAPGQPSDQPPDSDVKVEFEVSYSPDRPRWANEETYEDVDDGHAQPDHPGDAGQPNPEPEAESSTAVRPSTAEESSSSVRSAPADIQWGPPPPAEQGPQAPLGAFPAGPPADARADTPRSPQPAPARRPSMGKGSTGKGKRKPGVPLSSPPYPKRPHVTPRITPRPPSIPPPGYGLHTNQGIPLYHWDSSPPGYKIWVGDLPSDSNQKAIWNRIWDTLEEVGKEARWYHITTLNVKTAPAAVLTVSDSNSATDPQLT